MRSRSEPTVIGLVVNLVALWLALALVTLLVVAAGGMFGTYEVLVMNVLGLAGALLLVGRWISQRRRHRDLVNL